MCNLIFLYLRLPPSMGKCGVRSRFRKQQPKCSCCGKVGHRLETCKLPGAKVMLRLRKSLKLQRKQSKNKKPPKDDRSHSHKGGTFKIQAMKSYSKTEVQKGRDVRRLKSNTAEEATDGVAACRWLLDRGFVCKSKKCSHCHWTTLQGPFVKRRTGRQDHFFWRCSRNACNREEAFLARSFFCGLSLQPHQLQNMLLQYVGIPLMKTPLTMPFVQQQKVSEKVAYRFLSVLMERESASGVKSMDTINVSKEVEVDATSFGKFWIQRSSVLFQDQVQELERKHGKSLPSYPVHIRAVGALQRRGLMAVRMLPPKVRAIIFVPIIS